MMIFDLENESTRKMLEENKELKAALKACEQRFQEAARAGAKRKAPDWELNFMCDLFLNVQVENPTIPWLKLDEKTRKALYRMLLEFLDFIKEHGYSVHINHL